MPSTAFPQDVVLGLVRAISGDLPRGEAVSYLDPDVTVHMDTRVHRGIDLWYKWIHLIRRFGRLADLRMDPCEVREDAGHPGIVHVSIRWTGTLRRGRRLPAIDDVGRLRYQVEDGLITEIWTHKANYVAVFGPWIRSSAAYEGLLLWAYMYFKVLALRRDETLPMATSDQREGRRPHGAA